MMKKTLSIVALTLLLSCSLSAQSTWSLNTRAWTTNYWTSLIYGTARNVLVFVVSDDDAADGKAGTTPLDRILPSADLVFPVGIEKAGFTEINDIRGPYYYAFGHPFRHLGDYAIGIDASWSPSVVGLYAGAYFKSLEIVFAANDDHLRGYYLQPRAGIVLGRKKVSIEAGVFYDKTLGFFASPHMMDEMPKLDKGCLSDGLGLDVAASLSFTGKQRTILQFSMPFHNFLNENYAGGAFKDMHRRVGYIMLTHRINF